MYALAVKATNATVNATNNTTSGAEMTTFEGVALAMSIIAFLLAAWLVMSEY